MGILLSVFLKNLIKKELPQGWRPLQTIGNIPRVSVAGGKSLRVLWAPSYGLTKMEIEILSQCRKWNFGSIYIYIYIYMYIYVCICIYIYIYVYVDHASVVVFVRRASSDRYLDRRASVVLVRRPSRRFVIRRPSSPPVVILSETLRNKCQNVKMALQRSSGTQIQFQTNLTE